MTCVDLYRLGDYFQLGCMMDVALEKLVEHLKAIGDAYIREADVLEMDAEQLELVAEIYLNRVFKAAEEAYAQSSKTFQRLHQVFVRSIHSSNMLALGCGVVYDWMERVPQLALDTLRWAFRNDDGSNRVLVKLPKTCLHCNKTLSWAKTAAGQLARVTATSLYSDHYTGTSPLTFWNKCSDCSTAK
jgi:hypothetical protein